MGRENILSKLKHSAIAPVSHPGLFKPAENKQNLRDQFQQMIEAVGGKMFPTAAVKEMQSKIKEVYPDCQNIIDTTGKLKEYPSDEAFTKPHDAKDVDLAIIEGKLGVAENGAIWVTVENIKHRSILFLAENLVVILKSSDLVANMHQAYDKIEVPKPGFGLFLSGPSKTADIEQALVIGAHGSRSLSVFLS